MHSCLDNHEVCNSESPEYEALLYTSWQEFSQTFYM